MDKKISIFGISCFIIFRKEKNVTKTTNKIWNIYVASAITARVVLKWFTRFKNSDFEVEDCESSGRLVTTDTATITTVVHQTPHFTLREVADVVEDISMEKNTSIE